MDMLLKTLTPEQKKLLESYLKLAEENLPLNQLYVDLNNEERINVKKEKEAMALVQMLLANIADAPDREDHIVLLMKTDPFRRPETLPCRGPFNLRNPASFRFHLAMDTLAFG